MSRIQQADINFNNETVRIMGKGGGSLLLIRRQEPPCVVLTNPKKLRRLNNGPLLFQHSIHDT
jgi:hypothetical protein